MASPPSSSYFSLESLLQKFILRQIDFQAAWRCNWVFHFEEMMGKEKFGPLITVEGHGNKEFPFLGHRQRGLCAQFSETAEKGVHGRAWVLDTHMCTSAHIKTTRSHTHNTQTCMRMHTHTHNPHSVNCLHPHLRDPQPPPCKSSAGQGGAMVGPPPSRSISEHPALGPTSLLLFLGWTGFLTSSRGPFQI